VGVRSSPAAHAQSRNPRCIWHLPPRAALVSVWGQCYTCDVACDAGYKRSRAESVNLSPLPTTHGSLAIVERKTGYPVRPAEAPRLPTLTSMPIVSGAVPIHSRQAGAIFPGQRALAGFVSSVPSSSLRCAPAATFQTDVPRLRCERNPP